jgi:hypothetical protein
VPRVIKIGFFFQVKYVIMFLECYNLFLTLV